jgi:hypothetical protein
MKPVKTLGLAALAVVAVTALIGASSAMASTALCKVNEDPCAGANLTTEVHYTAEKILIHTSAMDYECSALLSAAVPKLGEKTQTLEAKSLVYSSCNQGCIRTVNKLGTFTVERTESEKAKITGSGFEIHVECGSFINCSYAFNELTGTLLGAGLTGDNGHITYNEATLERIGGLVCPAVATLSALFIASKPVYVKS